MDGIRSGFFFCQIWYINKADTDIQITGGGHPEIRGMPGLNKKNFSALRASVWSKNKGGRGAGSPGPLP